MSRYVVRIELHGASPEDHEKLHLFMQAVGFGRILDGGEGIGTIMPLGEYIGDMTHTIETVMELAKAAAAATGLPSGILITEARNMAWFDLEPAEPMN